MTESSTSRIGLVKRTAPKAITVKAVSAMRPGQVLADGYIRPGAGSLKVRRRKTAGGGGAPPEFIFLWQANGKTRSMVMGRFCLVEAGGALTLDQARAKAGELQAAIRTGQDPSVQRDLRREAVRAEEAAAVAAVAHGREKSLQALMDAYVQHLKERGKDASAYDTANVFLNHCISPFPDVVGLPASEVTPHHVSRILARLVGPTAQLKRGRTALKLRSFLSAAFRLGIGASVDPMAPSSAGDFKITANPVAQVPATRMAAVFNRAGDRVLSPEELRQYMLHMAALPSSITRLALSLQLVTGGQRFQQLLRLEHADIQSETLRMLDPKGRRAQPRPHLLPIVPEMREILDALVALNGTGPLFASRDSTLRPETLSIAVHDISVAMTHANPATPPFRGGDIRRTVETLLAERLGVSKDTRAQLLSHGLSGVQAQHYDKGAHLDAKRAALRAWNDLIADLCIGGAHEAKVFTFPAKAA